MTKLKQIFQIFRSALPISPRINEYFVIVITTSECTRSRDHFGISENRKHQFIGKRIKLQSTRAGWVCVAGGRRRLKGRGGGGVEADEQFWIWWPGNCRVPVGDAAGAPMPGVHDSRSVCICTPNGAYVKIITTRWGPDDDRSLCIVKWQQCFERIFIDGPNGPRETFSAILFLR